MKHNMASINKKYKKVGTSEYKIYYIAKWLTWLFLLGFLSLLIYIYYLAEFIFAGTRDVVFYKYYLVSFVGILFWGIVLKMSAHIRANIVTLMVALLLGIYMVEGILNFLPNKRQSAATELGINFDMRSKLEVIESLIENGIDAVPTFNPSKLALNGDEIDLYPLSGVSNKTTVYNNESGKYLIYKSDRYGFNNPDDQWNSTGLNWFLVGDSYAHGSAVQPGEEMAAQIRLATNSSAISVGYGGNGPLLEYATLVEYGEFMKPKNVLWLYYEGNDLGDNLFRTQQNSLLLNYMKNGFSQNLINRQQDIDTSLMQYIQLQQSKAKAKVKEKMLKRRFGWIKLGKIRYLLNLDNDVEVDADNQLFKDIMIKAKERVEAWKGKIYFVYLPEYARYKSKNIMHNNFRKKYEVIKIVKSLKIPVIDIHQELFANHKDPLSLFPLRLPGHFNAYGYAEVTKTILANESLN